MRVPIHQRGLTLVEVLVATVILAFGLLGIAGMQMSGIRANQGSYLRSQAVAVLSDFAEKIRANAAGAKTGAYAQFNSASISCGTTPTICAKEASSTPTTCTAAQLATYDQYVLVCGVPGAGGVRTGRLSDLLPSATMRIRCYTSSTSTTAFDLVDSTAAQCIAGSRLRLTLSWQDRGDIHQFAASASATNTVGQSATTQTLEMWVQP